MNGQQPQQGGDPELTYRDPKAYILWLRSRGLNPSQIDDLVTRRFGPGTTPEQRKQQQAKQQQQAGFAQTGGVIAGVVAGRYVMNNAGDWIDQLTGAEVTKEVVEQAAGSLNPGAANLTATTQTAWNAPGEAAASGATPQVIKTDGAMSTVNTPTGPQQVPTESLNDPGFWEAVNWGQVAQGGLALAQMYGAYQAYKKGDKTGALISGAAGAGNLAASTGAVATGSAAGTTGAYVIPGLNILAGAYQGYQTAQALGDMASGAQRNRTGIIGGATSGAAIGAGIGSIVPGPGTAIGAGIGAVVGAIAGLTGSLTGSSKDKGQMRRDAVRNGLQQAGILDENWNGTLADGSKFNFGQDGSKLNTKTMNKLQSDNPNAYSAAVNLGDALAASYDFMGDNARSLARLYVKGALSNAKDDPRVAVSNMQHFAKQQGITFDLMKTNLDKALASERIDQNEYNRLIGSAQQLTGGAGGPGGMPSQAPIPRPKKGEVARQSAGLYRNDQGKLIQATSMRQALERAYSNKQPDNKKKEK